ncbi:hypothetical protein [Saccharospirillum alexandrii]|uniref:hypothetical protein n=1 Tax=Saccharospirillum alexandrii TaxID=2448477 RepID=UPI0037363F0A
MAVQLTQGQQRLRTVNLISIISFVALFLVGQLYFSVGTTINGVGFSFTAFKTTFPFVFFAALALTFYLHKVLKTIYVRESSELMNGFYTQKSWLDVDDHKLVHADVANNQICTFEIPESRLSEVQAAYQQKASLSTLSEEARVKAKDIERITMSDIVRMSSSHKKDSIDIEYNEEHYTLEFLNIATKEHALKRLQLMLNDSMHYEKKTPTRIRAAFPWLATLLIFATIMTLFQQPYVWAILFGIGFFLILPKMLRELIDPSQVEIWTVETVETTN